ncbi:MAG: hypothetical protein Kow0076_0570 [Francisella sp.]
MYRRNKNSGSALLMALILSFVIMVMLSGLLYTFKMGLLTTKSIIKNNNEKILGETYISQVKDDIDFTKSSETKFGDSKFQIEVNQDDISSFFPNYTNAELFQAQQYNSYDVLYKAFNLGDQADLTERIIYNKVAANNYQSFNDDEFVPINVPMINVNAITDYQERDYRLTSDGTIDEDLKGFVGVIQKQNAQLSVYTNNAKIGIPIPKGIENNYKIKIGWDLKKGKWILYILLYDSEKIFTTSVALDDLLDEDKVKGLESDNQALGNQIGQWHSVVSGGGIGLSSSGEQFIKKGIIDVVWYFDKNNAPPEIVIARSDMQNGSQSQNQNQNDSNNDSNNDNKDNNAFQKITRQTLEIYYSEYSPTDGNYVVKLADKMEFKEQLNEDNVKLLVPDMANNLAANMVLIFHPNQQSKTLMGISDFNANGDHTVGKGLDTYIDGDSFGKPIIVSKSEDSLYIITFESNKLHRYEYKKGYGSFIALEYGANGLEKELKLDDKDDSYTVVVGLPDSQKDDKKDDGIQFVVPKFGYLFVFTSDKVLQLNYDLDIIQEIDLNASNPQILADFDAVNNTINKIYIQSKALSLKAQEMQDKLGDEGLPEDESEINDKNSDSSKDKSSTANDKDNSDSSDDNDDSDDSDDDKPPKRIYLETKYLYPLGIVKAVKL